MVTCAVNKHIPDLNGIRNILNYSYLLHLITLWLSFLLLSQHVGGSRAHENPQCLKLMSMHRSPKGVSCCHLTSYRKISSHRSGTAASLFQNVCRSHVEPHILTRGKIPANPARTQDRSSTRDVRGLCSGACTRLALRLCQEIYCWRYWAMIAMGLASELIQQLFNQETYKHCKATNFCLIPPCIKSSINHHRNRQCKQTVFLNIWSCLIEPWALQLTRYFYNQLYSWWEPTSCFSKQI